ncbi:MAG: nicotinate-nucleotide adenylyltransferase [Bacteroidales bacterium]|nr:nicotinate-nucleotide adenylyltransferase [Bacteroidales bacterium]
MEKNKERVGLLFGSFNPIHIGHLIIANYIVENTNINKIWFVVSPHNPLKNSKDLLEESLRYKLVKLAIKKNKNFKASDLEFGMEKPSYTIKTLRYLKSKYKTREFVLIIGEDNLDSFEKWKDYKEILSSYEIMVYPRANIRTDKFSDNRNIYRVKAPQIEISSTQIRENIRQNKSNAYLLPEAVRKEINNNNYYCNSQD